MDTRTGICFICIMIYSFQNTCQSVVPDDIYTDCATLVDYRHLSKTQVTEKGLTYISKGNPLIQQFPLPVTSEVPSIPLTLPVSYFAWAHNKSMR